MENSFVLGVGVEVGMLTHDYAIRIGKKNLLIESFFHVNELSTHVISNIDVVIILTSNISYDLIEYFGHSNSSNSSVGFITASSIYKLKNLINRIVNTRFDAKQDFTFKYIDLMSIKTQRVSNTNIKKILTSELDLLVLFTHSDGIDAFINKNLTGCPFTTITKVNGYENNLPQCLITNYCHRHKISRHLAKKNGLLFDFKLIQSKILILASCHGLLLPQSSISSQLTMLDRLVMSNKLTTIITTIGATILDSSNVEELIRYIFAFDTIGKAISKYNDIAKNKNLGIQFVIFGDSNLKIKKKSQIYIKEKIIKFKPPLSFFHSLRFLRMYMTIAIPNCQDELLMILNEVNIKLIELEFTFWTESGTEELYLLQNTQIYDALLCFWQKRGQTISIDWLKISDGIQFIGSSICSVCGTKTNLIRCEIRTMDNINRIVERCPVCSIIRDVPECFEKVDFIYTSKRLFFIGKLLSESNCAIMISNGDNYSNIMFKVRSNAFGKIIVDFKRLKNIPKGPLKISLFILNNLNIGVVTFATHSNYIYSDKD